MKSIKASVTTVAFLHLVWTLLMQSHPQRLGRLIFTDQRKPSLLWMCSHINTREIGWNVWTGKNCWTSTFAVSLQFDPLRGTPELSHSQREEQTWMDGDCNAVWSPSDRQSSSSRFTFVSERSSRLAELCKTASLWGQFIGYGPWLYFTLVLNS